MNIFVDGSYSNQRDTGVGAYIIISSEDLLKLSVLSIADLKIKLSKDIVYQVFKDSKGSTYVEQRILELALSNPKIIDKEKVTVYTDCQKTSKSINTYNVVHVKGHTKQANRVNTDKIFDVVDKTVRKRLREIIKECN